MKGSVPVTVFWVQRDEPDQLKEGWILIHPELLRSNDDEPDGTDTIDVIIAFIEKKYECDVKLYFGSREAAAAHGYKLNEE